MIILFTDFGTADPYVGQMHVVLQQQAPGIPVIDLMHTVPSFNVKAGAHLLPAYTRILPPECVVVAVVDPGVGSSRKPLMVQVGNGWYVGPDNGLFVPLLLRHRSAVVYQIDWQPEKLSESFHGRDLFAPVAARLAQGDLPAATRAEASNPGNFSRQLAEVIYLDHYGNGITGLEAGDLARDATIMTGGRELAYARTFAEVAPGECFWYENANGMVEIAANQDSAADSLGLQVGSKVEIKRG